MRVTFNDGLKFFSSLFTGKRKCSKKKPLQPIFQCHPSFSRVVLHYCTMNIFGSKSGHSKLIVKIALFFHFPQIFAIFDDIFPELQHSWHTLYFEKHQILQKKNFLRKMKKNLPVITIT